MRLLLLILQKVVTGKITRWRKPRMQDLLTKQEERWRPVTGILIAQGATFATMFGIVINKLSKHN